MPQLEQQLGCQAGGWSGNCLLGPARRWRLVPSPWYTEPRQPSPLAWCRWTFLCHQSHLRGKRKDLEVSTLAPLTSRQTSVTSFWKGRLKCWGCISYLGQAEQHASSQAFISISVVGLLNGALTIPECLGKSNLVQQVMHFFFSPCVASWEYRSSYFRYRALVLTFQEEGKKAKQEGPGGDSELLQSPALPFHHTLWRLSFCILVAPSRARRDLSALNTLWDQT